MARAEDGWEDSEEGPRFGTGRLVSTPTQKSAVEDPLLNVLFRASLAFLVGGNSASGFCGMICEKVLQVREVNGFASISLRCIYEGRKWKDN